MPPTKRPRRSLRRIVMTATVCLGLVVPTVIAAPAADAATSRTYSGSHMHWFGTLKRCIKVIISGTATFDTKTVTWGVADIYIKRKIVHPKVVVKTYSSCSPTVTGGHGLLAMRVTKVHIEQVWNDSVCKGGVSVTVGYPWMVGVTPTWSCGSVVAAHKTTTYGKKGSIFTQNNSLAKVSFANHDSAPIARRPGSGNPSKPVRWYKNCYSARVNVTVYVGNTSDTYPANFKPCVRH